MKLSSSKVHINGMTSNSYERLNYISYYRDENSFSRMGLLKTKLLHPVKITDLT